MLIWRHTDMKCSAVATVVAGRSLYLPVHLSIKSRKSFVLLCGRQEAKETPLSFSSYRLLAIRHFDTESSQQWSGNDASTCSETNDGFLISLSLCGDLYSISALSRPPECFLLWQLEMPTVSPAHYKLNKRVGRRWKQKPLCQACCCRARTLPRIQSSRGFHGSQHSDQPHPDLFFILFQSVWSEAI